jgi:hypothetical protein
MDSARFLNPARPGDLYISQFAFNDKNVAYANVVDAKVGIQIVQFSPSQLDPNVAVQDPVPTAKYCPPSAGPFQGLDVVKSGAAASSSDMSIVVYDSVDCNPTASSTVINIPYTKNACNKYTESSNSRFFKIRCMAGEQYNGLYANSKYLIKDFGSESECQNDGISPFVNAFGSLLSEGRWALFVAFRCARAFSAQALASSLFSSASQLPETGRPNLLHCDLLKLEC